jgi:hypothetical protein
MALPSIEAVTLDASEMKAMTEENTIQVHVWLTVEMTFSPETTGYRAKELSNFAL